MEQEIFEADIFSSDKKENSVFIKALEEFNKNNDFGEVPKENEIIPFDGYTISNDHIILSTNYKCDVFVPKTQPELSVLENATEVYITKVINKRKIVSVTGSLYHVKSVRDNEILNEILVDSVNNGTPITGIPLRYNNYGYDVMIEYDGASGLLHMPHLLTDMNKLPDPESIIGEEIQFIVKMNENNNYVASRKAYLKTLVKEELKNIVVGNIYTGFVTGSTNNAVFVQIGVLTGMIHVSNLSGEAQVLLKKKQVEPGMLIEVYVKSVSGGRLNLTQIWRESIWDTIDAGDLLIGTISEIKEFGRDDYGVLVQLDYETRGMLHSSVLPNDMSNYVVGDEIKVLVKYYDIDKRQITLVLP